jgi:hypothetical protein
MEEREIPLSRWLYKMSHFALMVQPFQRYSNLESGPRTMRRTGFYSGVLNLQNTYWWHSWQFSQWNESELTTGDKLFKLIRVILFNICHTFYID